MVFNTSLISMSEDELISLCNTLKADHPQIPDVSHPITQRPSQLIVWGLGLSIVTFITLSAIVGIIFMKTMNKSTYSRFITFFVAVGVGSLSGSAVFHLLPQAFGLVNEFDPNASHAYLSKALTAVCGIYLFFIADKVIKIILETRKRRQRQQGHHGHDHSNHLLTDTPRNNSVELKDLSTTAAEKSIQQQAHSLCVHDHDMQYQQGDSVVATVAWMIIFGDGLHNFIDGVSIGASFTESLLSGFSVSVAVMCEEFPHELGDVAILVASGMTLKQALAYNLLSALTCYVGFAIGAMFGNLDDQFAPYIFAFAGGMFLYISISCMIPEMKKAMEEGLHVSFRNGIEVFMLQILGIFCGLSLMFVMARYGALISVSF